VKRIAAEIVKENPGRSVSYTARLFGLQDFVAKGIRPYLLLFLGAAALLLLVSCANVAGLLVARSVGRAQEIAVRIALGASKTDLGLQFILEGCMISLAAGALGLIASVGLTRLIVSLASEYIPRAEEFSTDGIVVLFVAGVACLTTVLPASPAVSLGGAIPADGILAGRLKFHSSPLSYAADEMDAALRWARERKPQHTPEIEYLREMGLRLAVPLRTKDEVRGILLLGPPLARNQYSSADIDVMHLYAQQLALTMETARLTERALEHEKIRQDVALAAEVQDRLLPQRSIETEANTVAAFTLPARGIGGDCYDFLDLAEHGVGIALADVAGKGIAAALIMAAVQASLRIIAEEGRLSPAQLVAKLNSFLHRSTRSASYATFFYAQFDAQAQQLLYVNAGHNPPYFVRSFGSSPAAIEELKAGGTIVGMFPDSEY
jgi:serine phosphatase RsbU (regulator of sigma subunit)